MHSTDRSIFSAIRSSQAADEYQPIVSLPPVLPNEACRLLFIRQLPRAVTVEQIYELFGRCGEIENVWRGNTPHTKGTTFVLFAHIYDAKQAVDTLHNMKIGNRFLNVSYFSKERAERAAEIKAKRSRVLETQGIVFADG